MHHLASQTFKSCKTLLFSIHLLSACSFFLLSFWVSPSMFSLVPLPLDRSRHSLPILVIFLCACSGKSRSLIFQPLKDVNVHCHFARCTLAMYNVHLCIFNNMSTVYLCSTPYCPSENIFFSFSPVMKRSIVQDVLFLEVRLHTFFVVVEYIKWIDNTIHCYKQLFFLLNAEVVVFWKTIE